MANNRAVTLDGANKIFENVGIKIVQDPDLGHYQATGRIEAKSRTLTALCQSIIAKLIELPPTKNGTIA